MSRSTAGSGPVTRASGSHARIGWSQGGGIVAHDARTSRGVVGNANDAVEPVAHLFDVRDENDLRETIAQTAQERSEEHTSELQSQSNLVCRLLLEKKKTETSIGWRVRKTHSPMVSSASSTSKPVKTGSLARRRCRWRRRRGVDHRWGDTKIGCASL